MKMLSTLAVMGAMGEVLARFGAQSDISLETEYAPTVALQARLRAGEAADIAILTQRGVDDLIAEGIILDGTRSDLARSFIGIAVKAGASKPNIATTEAFVTTLVGARAVAYSNIGASGIAFASMLGRLRLNGKVKTLVVPTGFTAERLVTGEADLAVQQISELMVVPGIEVVGPLPSDLQTTAVFSVGIPANTASLDDSRALLRFLTSPEIAGILRNAGLEPVLS